MIITDFERNVVQLYGNAKKKHERFTENTIEEKKILKIKIYSFWHMMCYMTITYLQIQRQI